jgi:hypothetical protein
MRKLKRKRTSPLFLAEFEKSAAAADIFFCLVKTSHKRYYKADTNLGNLLLGRVDLLGNAAQLKVGLAEDGLHIGPQVQEAALQAHLPLLVLALLNICRIFKGLSH